MTMSNKPTVKAPASLDGSLLLARKGEASPAVAATQHNNPALAWGAPAHPGDFQPRVEPQATHQPTHHQPTHQAGQSASVTRLRPDSFFAHASASGTGHGIAAGHGRGHTLGHTLARTTRATQERDPVALTMRVEDETYLRLKYLAQHTGRSTQQVLAEALDHHLVNSGVPHSRRLVVKPE